MTTEQLGFRFNWTISNGFLRVLDFVDEIVFLSIAMHKFLV